MPERPASRTYLLSPAVAPETPETMPKMREAVVDAVDGVAIQAPGCLRPWLRLATSH